MTRPDAEARRALARLTRALEKAGRELDAFEGALRQVEGPGFSPTGCADARGHLGELVVFVEDEGERLRDLLLRAGGIEPGGLRSGSDGD